MSKPIRISPQDYRKFADVPSKRAAWWDGASTGFYVGVVVAWMIVRVLSR